MHCGAFFTGSAAFYCSAELTATLVAYRNFEAVTDGFGQNQTASDKTTTVSFRYKNHPGYTPGYDSVAVKKEAKNTDGYSESSNLSLSATNFEGLSRVRRPLFRA